MPYRTNDDLPPAVQRLPEHAQDIFREAFNHAWERYGQRRDPEQVAFRVAWAAIKKQYRKEGDSWLLR
ncbi:MAG: ChaB family protein [Alphaproteobacteria bacterium]|nr:ChaB family protein [Alphaproteobacteria bacterium]MBL7097763.1 ChaB family protein [Alphaproteobacteria bacterium]